MVNPKLRFKKPDGTAYPDWERHSLEDVLRVETIRNGGRFATDAVLSVSDEYGVVNQIALQGRSFAAEDVSNYKVVKKGQIVYTRSPLKAKPFGIIKIVGDEEGIVSPLYIVNTVKDGYEPSFIYEYFNLASRTNNYLKAKVRMGAKHTMNISEAEWLSGSIVVPCYEEQKRIDSMLSSVEKLISEENLIIASLERRKKAVMNMLISQQIRFKDENGEFYPEWEHLCLGDVIEELSTGKSVNSSDDDALDTDIAVLKTSCVYRDVFDPYEKKKVVPDETDLVKCPVCKGTIIVSRMNTPQLIGACGYVDKDYPNVFLPDRLWKLEIKPNADAYYIYRLLVSPFYKKRIQEMASGTSGSMYNIAQGDFASIEIDLPSLPEQKRIADFFTALDAQIENERHCWGTGGS